MYKHGDRILVRGKPGVLHIVGREMMMQCLKVANEPMDSAQEKYHWLFIPDKPRNEFERNCSGTIPMAYNRTFGHADSMYLLSTDFEDAREHQNYLRDHVTLDKPAAPGASLVSMDFGEYVESRVLASYQGNAKMKRMLVC
jgi:hypothetical protein